MLFNQEIKEINRGTEIVQTLLKYGFEDFANNSPLSALIPKGRMMRKTTEDGLKKYTRWELIRMVFEDLGPTFVKLAQVLSNRRDILPPELVDQFEKLQSNVAPFGYDKAKEIIEFELGKPIDEVFDHFGKKPLASASIGQVHRATLKTTGEMVVIKVQRPDIQKTVETDLAIIRRILTRGEDYFERKFGLTNGLDFLREFERTMQKELVYTNELRNIKQFREFYKDYDSFYIPKAYKKYSTEKVLTIEYRKGCKITDVDQMRSWGLHPEEIAERGMDIYMTQMFEYGYFHADPHPGNILIQQDGTICLIDFGMVGRLQKRDKYSFAWVLISMARQDPQGMARHLRKLSTYDEITNRRDFENDLNEIIEDFGDLDISETNIAELGMRLQKVIHKYKMKVPANLFLLLRALAILEGIGKEIHPTFNSYDYIKPYGKKLLRDLFSLENIAEEIGLRINQADYFIRNFPLDIQEILRDIRKGRFHVEVSHQNYEPAVERLNSAANRMMLTLLIVGLMISSSIIATANLPRTARAEMGLPYISLLGFAIAGFLTLWLFWKARKQ